MIWTPIAIIRKRAAKGKTMVSLPIPVAVRINAPVTIAIHVMTIPEYGTFIQY